MDDVEIVVTGRKGIDEQKALKLLGKFLKRDQEKDVDDQLPADVVHQLQQVRDSLEGKDVGPLVLSSLSSPLGASASASSPQGQEEEVEFGDGGAAAKADAQEQEEGGAAAPKRSEKKHKKKRHKKE